MNFNYSLLYLLQINNNMKQADSKFIIEVSHPSFNEHTFISKIGNEACYVRFTDDIYKAKSFDSEKTAKKTADRAVKYINEAYERGWTTYGYDWDSVNHVFRNRLKDIEATVREIKLIIVK